MPDIASIDSRIDQELNALERCPSIQAVGALAFSYLDLLGCFARDFDGDAALDCMQCIEALGYRCPDFEEKVAWQISRILFRQRDRLMHPLLDSFFCHISSMRRPLPRTLRRSLLAGFSLNSRIWSSFALFCEWWGFSNLEDSDFAPSPSTVPLGCEAYLAYARAILKQSLSPLCLNFWADMARRMPAGGFSVYANLHLADFMTRAGFGTKTVLRVLRPLVVQKFRKPWVWLAVSDLFSDYPLKRKACLLFALSCFGNVDQSRSLAVLWKLAQYSFQAGEIDNCRYFVNRLWQSGSSYRAKILSDFGSMVDLKPHFCEISPDFDFRAICHEIFAEVKDPGPDFWARTSLEILNAKFS